MYAVIMVQVGVDTRVQMDAVSRLPRHQVAVGLNLLVVVVKVQMAGDSKLQVGTVNRL